MSAGEIVGVEEHNLPVGAKYRYVGTDPAQIERIDVVRLDGTSISTIQNDSIEDADRTVEIVDSSLRVNKDLVAIGYPSASSYPSTNRYVLCSVAPSNGKPYEGFVIYDHFSDGALVHAE